MIQGQYCKQLDEIDAASPGASARHARCVDRWRPGQCRGTFQRGAWRNLGPALAKLLETRRPTSEHGVEVGLGWFFSSGHGDEIVWKDGGSGGFAAFIGFSRVSRQGSIVLSNAANWHYLDDIGMHLINSNFRLLK